MLDTDPLASSFHLAHTRAPLQKPPLSDLLPKGYLATLRRTVERVRFRNGSDDEYNVNESNARAGGRSMKGEDKASRQKQQSPLRSRPRSHSRQRKVRMARSTSSNEDFKADQKGIPASRTTPEVVTDGQATGDLCSLDNHSNGPSQHELTLENTVSNGSHSERLQQYKQLNVPISTPEVTSGIVHTGDDILRLDSSHATSLRPEQDDAATEFGEARHRNADRDSGLHDPLIDQEAISTSALPSTETLPQKARPAAATKSQFEHGRQTSAISSPFPPNLPLSIIRLVESYVNQFVASEAWSAGQGEKGYLLVSLSNTIHTADSGELMLLHA